MNLNDYRQSHKGEGFGSYYEKTLDYAWQKMLLGMERSFLGTLLSEYSPENALDFACGTGRILEFLSSRVEKCYGVDISADMLDVCRDKVSESTKIICGDITQEERILEPDLKFSWISTFRFFPNAQQGLREDVMGALVEHLADDGVLVFNNHRNSSSFLYSLSRVLRRSNMQSMSRSEVHVLIEKFGLKIVGKKCFGVLPAWNQFVLAPLWLHRGLDRVVSALGLGECLAQDVVYVCRRAI